jgi:YHS domain-containing protein
MKKTALLVLAFLAALCFSAAAQKGPPPTTSGGSGEALLNLDNTIAVHGYDPMAYFTEKGAIKGNKRIYARIGGGTYYFASRASRYEFLSDAPRYQPQFGGYCTTSMSFGRLEDINPHVFALYNGKLYLFRDPEAQSLFWANPERTIRDATFNYFELAKKKRERW